MSVDEMLLIFTKDLLGFHGHGADRLLSALILSAEQYLQSAGVIKPVLPANPTPEQLFAHEKKIALYNLAVAVRVKALHDDDPKGNLSAVLTSMVAQMRAGG